MTLDKYFDAMRAASGGILPLDTEQEKALCHSYETPLWVIAGPGTGKTHTLVWLALKRMLVDGIAPEDMVLTTFTRKAAAELETRLRRARKELIDVGVTEAKDLALERMLIGTLHGICNRVLQDQRYEKARHLRLLEDELTQQFFLRRSHNPLLKEDDLDFWAKFGLEARSWGGAPNVPNTAKRAEGAAKLFNRISETSADIGEMFSSTDDAFQKLANAYSIYEAALEKINTCDQAHLQKHFLNFLNTPEGKAWVGIGLTVIVDEYQDTNPIQEKIYFALTGTGHDLTVVGDDDQSLYRFRGATVESLVNFDVRCIQFGKPKPTAIYLHENRRSHAQIVKWVNRFIGTHPDMKDPDIPVRAPGKPPLVPKADLPDSYPGVMAICDSQQKACADKLVRCLLELKNGGFVTDWSQIALLTFSTKESTRTNGMIGDYTQAIRAANIPVFNPRSGRAQLNEIFQCLLASIAFVVDPNGTRVQNPIVGQNVSVPKAVCEYVNTIQSKLRDLIDSGAYPDLENYIAKSVDAITSATMRTDGRDTFARRPGDARATLGGLLFRLLSLEPFASAFSSEEGAAHVKALNSILAEYEILYDGGVLKLEADPFNPGLCQVEGWTLYNFYSVFVEGFHDKLNQAEDDEVSVLEGFVNIMTIHQSKGLEFEVVFVLRPDKMPFESDTHLIEDELAPFIADLKGVKRRSSSQRAAEDAVRLFFVAHSRAKRLLVLVGYNPSEWARSVGYSSSGFPLITSSHLSAEGVLVL